MTLGLAERQGNLFDEVSRFCEAELPATSIYALLHRERDNLFPDEFFADLFSNHGRRSVPPSVVSVVMVCQRLEGLSDRDAVEHFCFDARWRYAAGVGGYDNTPWTSFAHTVLVDMRERLRCSDNPDRIFEVALGAARDAGIIGRRRVLDSTPLYDAVATMDTVTLIRASIRGLLAVAEPSLEAELRGLLRRDDDYASAGKPVCDWDDKAAREVLVDELALDAYAALMALDGRALGLELTQAAQLLAAVCGQDLELATSDAEDDDEVFRIARRVAPDRIISTVDTQTRHGHKTQSKGFDGFKAHVGIDPDSEIITATTVTAGNAGDASVAKQLIADLVKDEQTTEATSTEATSTEAANNIVPSVTEPEHQDEQSPGASDRRAKVYGDQAYGTGEFQRFLEDHDLDSACKTQAPCAAGGMFTKAVFDINLVDDTVTCPNQITVAIRRNTAGQGTAYFAEACIACALRDQCTKAAAGRSIHVGIHEDSLARARARQANPEWAQDYRATRPKVERKLGHLMFRKHGGRRARVRGKTKVAADFSLLAAATNLARLAVLGLNNTNGCWVVAGA
jgi:IS5 family transposase